MFGKSTSIVGGGVIYIFDVQLVSDCKILFSTDMCLAKSARAQILQRTVSVTEIF